MEQAGSAVAIATPFDAQIATLSAELDATRLYYGSAEQRAAMAAKVEATDAPQRGSVGGGARAARRVQRQRSGASNFFGERELVADVASGRVDIAAVPAAQLPAAVAALPVEEQRALLDGDGAEARRSCNGRSRRSPRNAMRISKAEVEAAGGADDSLDQQIYDAVREQAAPLGLDYEDGPRF